MSKVLSRERISVTADPPAAVLDSEADARTGAGDPLQSAAIDNIEVTQTVVSLSTRVAAGAGRDVPLGCVMRPSWRGRIHLIALCAALPGLGTLIGSVDTSRARIGTIIYAIGYCSMLAVSVTYHRWVHGLRARAWWRRADHAMIFAAIAGSSTPVVLIVMPHRAGLVLIAAMWSTALFGAALKLCRWQRGDTVGTRFYIAVSVMAGLPLPWLYAAAGLRPSILFVVSGMVYIAGSITFANRWPTLKRPAVFSYHEVWHLLTVVAAAAHFAAVWPIAT